VRSFPTSLTARRGAVADANSSQTGSCHAPEEEWKILKSPNQRWILTLDCVHWGLWEDTNTPGYPHVFWLPVDQSDFAFLGGDGSIQIVAKRIVDGYDVRDVLWTTGPLGNSDFYELKVVDEGDLVLYDGSGAAIWRAVGNLPNTHPGP